MLRSKLVALFAVSAAVLSGCVIRDASDDEHSSGAPCDDYDYNFGGDGSGAAGSGANGNEGGGGEGGAGASSCLEHADCAAGWYCDEEGACAASAECEDDDACDEGFICDADLASCIPGERTCEELDTELACSERADCEPVYAGVDCSCGPDCTCIGGEPGCVCESFEFFTCDPAS